MRALCKYNELVLTILGARISMNILYFLLVPYLSYYVDSVAVNDYVGFGLMDASKMVSLAANWSTVPEKLNCTIEHIGVNK